MVERSEEDSKVKERDMVGIHYQVADTELSHDCDVVSFGEKVQEVFEFFYKEDHQGANENEENRYLAPYFVFVQSSGMGKTKILYEFKNQVRQKKGKWENTDVKLILCRGKKYGDDGEKEEKIFDEFIAFSDIANESNIQQDDKNKALDESPESETQTKKRITDTIHEKLEEMLPKTTTTTTTTTTGQRLVLLFDESHYLTGELFNQDGLMFRAVRLWIRKVRKTKVVAVFTGTTPKLINFDIEIDKTNEETDSRRMSIDFYPRGKLLFDPWYMTTTIGCVDVGQTSDPEGDSEWRAAAKYGRPLFASMIKNNEFSDESKAVIIKRMLLSKDNWQENDAVGINILATRVQMGQTSVSISSDLVARGYANLVGAEGESLRITYPADPVCAHIAMCLMDDKHEFILKHGSIHGISKNGWVTKFKKLYTGKLFTPEKGDVAEIMVALYLLFCADELRAKECSKYQVFSVPMEKWIKSLKETGVSASSEGDKAPEASSKIGSSQHI